MAAGLRIRLALSLLALAWVATLHGSAGADEGLAGPIEAQVVRVLDGDTLQVRAHIWLGQQVDTRVRLAGIDAPELRGRCRGERDLAQRARAHVMAVLSPADGGPAQVSLYDIQIDKFGGRVLARVLTAAGTDLGASLLAAGLARPYGGKSRLQWCTAEG